VGEIAARSVSRLLSVLIENKVKSWRLFFCACLSGGWLAHAKLTQGSPDQDSGSGDALSPSLRRDVRLQRLWDVVGKPCREHLHSAQWRNGCQEDFK
jgi:hypothetical protein